MRWKATASASPIRSASRSPNTPNTNRRNAGRAIQPMKVSGGAGHRRVGAAATACAAWSRLENAQLVESRHTSPGPTR